VALPVAQGDLPKIEYCDEGCTFLGAFEQLPKFKKGCLVLPKGAQILCYTDGVTELSTAQREMYGEERLSGFAEAQSHLLPEAFNERLLNELRDFQGEAEPIDDVTVLSLRLH
jgi:sigma-B regulation protein RsbU (phosphoserine phosphatase)